MMQEETNKDTVTLIIKGTESTLPAEELTIERIVAEARAVGYAEFSVFCGEKEITEPGKLKVIAGAHYFITPPEADLDMSDIDYEIIEEEENGA